MSMPNKITSALKRVMSVTDKYQAHILHTKDMSRQDRELLVNTDWLHEITKGWYMLTRPDLAPGDSAAWYANFWDFE